MPYPKGSISRLLKRGILVYLRPYWRSQLVLVVTVVLSVMLHTSLPFSLKFLIDSAIIPRDEQMLVLILTGLGILFVLYSIGGVVQAYLQAELGTKLKTDLRLELFTHLQDLPVSYFDHIQPGEITELFARELLTLRAALRDLTTHGLQALLMLVVTTTALFILNWRLSLVIAAILPLTIILPRWILSKSTKADYEEHHQDAEIAFAVQDNVATQSLLRAFGVRDLAIAKFTSAMGQTDEPAGPYAEFKRRLKTPHFLRSLVVVWTDIQQVIILGLTVGIGAYLAWQNQLTIGTFSAFIVLLAQVGRSITALSVFVQNLISAATALARIERVTNTSPEITDPTQAITLPTISKEIQFVDVSFGYPGQQLQLKQISFAFQVRQTVAFVGRSGAGKSTLLKLLLRFYDPVEGQILIDGYDLRTVSQASYRRQIGVVLQEAPLLNTSIRENICLVKPDAAEAEVIAAAKLAEIHDAIVNLPRGYDTQVGEGGKWLSTGQRQRIALARALLHNPPLLLLDEITSALDLETEAAINRTLKKLALTHTVVVVTHRLSSVVDTDQIVVVDDGQIIEQGRHRELLRRKGFYRRLWQLQTGFVISADGHYAEITGARLRFIPLFERLDDATLERLADQFVSEYYDAEQTVFGQDSPGDKFYIIVRGKVAVTSSAAAGEESVTIAYLEDGDYFGEIALIESCLRSATVQTVLPSLFLTLDRDRFEQMLIDLPDLQEAVQKKAHQRTMEMVNTLGQKAPSIPV